jgi:ABA4-like protein
MTPETVFQVANAVALLTWIVLALFQRRRWAATGVAITAVLLFAAAYATIVGTIWGSLSGDFSSLGGVALLFSNKWALLAGWIHYIAFDLLVGRWETQDAAARGISPWLVVPCLALTFMFGPAGWLLYVTLRTVHAQVQNSTRTATDPRVVHAG